MSEQVAPADLGWEDILVEPFVTLILGARGEGKTALSHRLLEEFVSDDRDGYIMGFPRDKRDLLPAWLQILPTGTTRDRWPEDSIVLIHEAHQTLHARRSMDVENLELDQLVTVSRHKNSNILYDTQQSQRLDRNAVAAVDGILVRWPALMQEEFERRGVRPIIEDARETLEKYVEVHEGDDYTYVERRQDEDGVDLLKKHIYVHSDRFIGEYPHDIELARHWSEDISKAYGSAEELTDEADEAGDEDDGEDPLDAFAADSKHQTVLRNALRLERAGNGDWEAADVGASGGQISAMLSAGVITREYRSNNIKTFSLTDPERVAEKLSEYADG